MFYLNIIFGELTIIKIYIYTFLVVTYKILNFILIKER